MLTPLIQSALLAVALSPVPAVYQPATPFFVGSQLSRRIYLPASALACLRRWNPAFRIWTPRDYVPDITAYYPDSSLEAPFAVIGDFNSDGRLDVVLHGHTKTRSIVVCLLSHIDAFTAILISSSGRLPPPSPASDSRVDSYLAREFPGTIEVPTEGTRLQLTVDAFIFGHAGRTAGLYYMAEGRFRALLIGD